MTAAGPTAPPQARPRLQTSGSSVVPSSRAAPVIAPDGTVYTRDEGYRADSDLARLGALRPVFDRPTGAVTAGNSAQVTDGAALLLLASEEARCAMKTLWTIEQDATDGFCRLGIDDPSHAVNLLSVAALDELDACIAQVENGLETGSESRPHPDPIKGLIIHSRKPKGFIAGACDSGSSRATAAPGAPFAYSAPSPPCRPC